MIKTAYELGRKAFLEGKIRVPAMDIEFLNTCMSEAVSKDSVKKLIAWSKGWDCENLKADY